MNSLAVSQSDTNTNFSNWASKFIAVLDKHAPVRYKRVKRDTQPEWFNDDIKFAMKQRDKLITLLPSLIASRWVGRQTQ